MRQNNRKNSRTFPDSTFDTLEARQLLTVVRVENWLFITATEGDDLIVLTNTATKVKIDINNEHHEFNLIYPPIHHLKVRALAGNDTIRNSTILHTDIYAGAGDDLIYGGVDADTVYADHDQGGPVSDGDDTIYGGAGNDFVGSYRGRDYIDGGPGGAFVDFSPRSQGMIINLNGKPAFEGTTPITIKNVNGVFATRFADRITGNSGNNQLAGNGGNDVISGQGGDDIISVSDGAATVRGGSGNDEFSIYEGNIFNDDNRHELYGEGGNDRFYSDLEVDSSTVYGGSGDDVVSAFAGDLYGQAGNDTVNFSLDGSFVGSHSQIIDGGSDSDHLTLAMSGVGARITLDLIANDGRRNTSDACNVRYFEWLTSGHRADLLDASLSTQGVRLDGNGDNDTLIGSNYADSLYGGEFHDSIQGNGGDDLLDGGTGNDKLIGGLGIDTYFGGSGNDTISAADGLADIIDGGDGTDEADIDEGLDQTIGVEVLT